jgi:hypothetical protein
MQGSAVPAPGLGGLLAEGKDNIFGWSDRLSAGDITFPGIELVDQRRDLFRLATIQTRNFGFSIASDVSDGALHVGLGKAGMTVDTLNVEPRAKAGTHAVQRAGNLTAI